MQEITNIIKSGKDNYNIFLDGVFFCKLNAETIIKEKLKVGNFISKERIEKAQLENEKLIAFEKALKFIENLKTKKQIIDYLYSKGYTQETIKNCIDKLNEYGYINDESYANQYVENYKYKKGRKLLEFELKSKGVPEEIINKALKNYTTNEEYIINLAEKYLKNKEKNKSTLKKTISYLFSKGFTFDEINPIIKKLFYDFGENDESWN